MTDNSAHSEGSRHATMLQAEASRPDQSVIVSANAGTGKTKVLTQRVLRLLLSGAHPDTILCVTFTKAAAAEMRHRLYESLADWAIWSESKLLAHFAEIGEARPTQEQIKIARNLFAHILDHEDGPRIETVHSFCQSVLSRFPLEAGVPPHFQLASDIEAAGLCQDSFYRVVSRPSPALIEDVAHLSGWVDDSNLSDYVRQVVSNRDLVTPYANDPHALARFDNYMKDELGLFDPARLEMLAEETVAELQRHKIGEVAEMLLHGGAIVQKRGHKITQWYALQDSVKPSHLAVLVEAFFTQKGEQYKTYSSKALDEIYPDCAARQQPIIDILEAYVQNKVGAMCRRLSLALARLSAETFRQFQSEKALYGLLDYDDLIYFTEALLSQDQMMAWVRWKLDNGINHLLVDEAQDTSPTQWTLLRKLSDPFFETSDDDEKARTFFAVGDFKQSIYSFQGADPLVFETTTSAIFNAAKAGQKPVKKIPFTRSFRSSAAVLQFVDKVMGDTRISGAGEHYQPHDIEKEAIPGLVEVWPITVGEGRDEAPSFFPPALADQHSAETKHADKVAAHIAGLISGHDSHLGPVAPGDILILLRKRDRFSALLRAALQAAGLPVAGADRLTLNSQIEIQDLLALGDVCLLPEDDLQLAALLKSPLLGCDEEALLSLAASRGKQSLFEALMRHDGAADSYGSACEALARWRSMADQMPVFEFYSAVLTQGGRAAFHHRLGASVDDSLNAFLLRAREHGKTGSSGLSHFLSEFRQGGGDIKRDMDAKAGTDIRIMTIHGAKGLEAPIVYLPDMLASPKPAERIVMSEHGVFLCPGAVFRPDFFEQAKSLTKGQQYEEEDRLLYVALTRARNALFISGWQQLRRRKNEGSWYQLASDIIADLLQTQASDEQVMRYQTGQREDVEAQKIEAPLHSGAIPSWYTTPPQVEPTPLRPLTPSDLGDSDIVMPFSASNRIQARLTGTFAHQLLEILPRLSPEHWDVASARLSASYQTGRQPLSPENCQKTIADVKALIAAPRWQALFAADALCEAPVVGTVRGLSVSAQIDRMLITDSHIIIADFKTGRPPHHNEATPTAYCRQMALYGALLAEIYPDKEISCWLIWTQDLSERQVTAKQRADIILTLG